MRLGPVVLPIWSSGKSSPIIRRNQPKHNVMEKRIALSRTQFRCFRLAFHSLSFLLRFSRQPYNAREFSHLWLGIGAPTRSAPCATAESAHPWSRVWFWDYTLPSPQVQSILIWDQSIELAPIWVSPKRCFETKHTTMSNIQKNQ
jgi:hypothetical protein